ncbi:MAG: PASTA domain-containing protein, partial [Actinomycetota bacterium]|nr:PASTA domain-containing protein [Actinomycetota bacterium]
LGPARPPAQDHSRGAEPARPRKRRRWLRTLIGAVILLLLAALLTYGSWWFASGRYSSVPDVSRQRVDAATQKLRDQGFAVATDHPVADDGVPKGWVISTEPSNGSRLVRGRTVHLVISAGPTFFSVPDLHGQPRAAAGARLAGLVKRGVQVVYSERFDDSVAAGSVINTSPAAGRAVKRTDVVTVYVSTGPPLVDVPVVTGRSKDDAAAILISRKFKVNTEEQFSDTVGPGDVISQNPSGGSARKFSPVKLVVSKGPELVAVPQLPNLARLEDARRLMEGAGFVVRVQRSFGGGNGLVVGIDPPAGTRLRKGATVTLYVV